MSCFACTLATPAGELLIRSDGTAINQVHFIRPEETPYATNDHHPLLDQCQQQLREYFEGRRRIFSLPLRQEGTAFQQRVWATLLQIPFGSTLSYRDLAMQLGDVKATRAVGFSNGRNQIAILVPCHRVIGSNGSLTGYAAGTPRKKWLLEHEAREAFGVQILF